DVKDSLGNHVDTDANFICDVCGYELPVPVEWTEAQKSIFREHLFGFELPCLKGLDVVWDAETLSVVVSGAAVDSESFNVYVNSIVAQGFSKEAGPYEDSYILLKDLEVENKTRTIEIDTFINSGVLWAICYDPYLYEWPADLVTYYYENCYYIAPNAKIPAIAADRYAVNTSYMESKSILAINCYSNTNLEAAYKEALTKNGFNVSESKNEDGAYVATEPQKISQVLFAYSESDKALSIVVAPGDGGWPAFVVDYYTDQLTQASGTKVPAVVGANSCEFIDVYSRYHYFFVLCESDNDLTKAYEAALEEDYTLYNDSKNSAGNYWAISDNEDLLVQYVYIVTESPFGGEDYKHFDVLFEDYHPHNEEHINAGLQIINEGTETTLPAYPGYGERIDFSDSDIYMTVTIQASTFDSMSQYMSILDEAGWSVKDLYSQIYNYEAISPDRDIRLESSIIDGRMTLTLSAYEDPYSDWPTEGITEILTTLGIEGEVPVFDGAFGYDYENTEYYHDIVCIVKTNKEEELVNAYIEKITGLGWKHIVEGDLDYYVKEGSDVGLVPYYESKGTGYCYIEIIHGDGTKYDIDARTAFVDWKIYFDIKSNIQIPGIILNDNVANIELAMDAGETYEFYYVFRLTVELTDGEVSSAISTINSTFENDGWVYSSDDHYYHKEDMWLNAHEIDGKVVIDICSPIPMNDLETLVKRFVFDEELTEYVKIPENFNIVGEYELAVSKYDIDNVVLNATLTFENYDAAIAAKNAILEAFKSKGWDEVDSDPNHLINDSGWAACLETILSIDDDSNVLNLLFKSPYF
ncbi:MAG: hypothetical protein MJ222_04765, partial [Bacilli bacterium]|nr:hypothetical protein [Bacilli bacterium]